MNQKKILYWSVIVAFAGFLFGFDTVVISGADKQLQQLWGSSDLFHGLVVMSSALWGTVIGAVFGAFPTNILGRKNTLLLIGILFFVSSVGTAFANDPFLFSIFRFLGGIGIGASTIAAPTYVSEIAPAKDRGKLVALYQFNIVFGILIAFTSNYYLQDIGANSWRWMLGIQSFPSLIYTLLIFWIPESPRWILEYKKDVNKARAILKQIYTDEAVATAIDAMEKETQQEDKNESIFMKKYRKPLLLAFFIAFFNQLSGINAFLYYAPRIFELAGLEKSASFLSSIGIGIINLIFTMIGIALIDRFGRKTLMYLGSVGYIISLGLVTTAFHYEWKGMAVPLFFFLFIASHAIGQGAVIWVFISELFPNKLRAAGSSFGTSVHWVLAALIPSFIPFLFKEIGTTTVFAIFCLMMVLQLLWVFTKMPETKGRTLEELSESLSK
ncbi:sugar porter family MFS transporter [Flavobacterium turcicum]|uniref:Sugar porter family MFS transporter n=1 Tax=Flavobacterium turcicum TaxID=2764718 RepID=A0ABR7JDV7_9FLAO|nr:sugar porter family MFS transporter [Flavobacterium turcicum]MBC5862344.1 sugar porter family MFS transporter [Flavobacterium turcicum]NHL01075.1 sugar porter family MFS transporter [Flavobacterium turcicum]